MVFAFEGEAAEYFNSEKSQRDLEKLGYYLEFGYHWSAGVYVTG